MIRTLFVILGVVCVAVVLTEAAAIGMLWHQGQIDQNTIQDIRMVVFESNDESLTADGDEDDLGPSSADVVSDRSKRILLLDRRESELSLLEQWVDEKANQLSKDRNTFEQSKMMFEKSLAELNETITSEAVNEARGILLALAPNDAVVMLMGADLEQNILLIKSMPEKKISGILTEFLNNEGELAPQEQMAREKRGHEIFEAISQGQPRKQLIDDVQRQATVEPAARQ